MVKALFALIGAAVTGLTLLVAKLLGDKKKGEAVEAPDTDKAAVAAGKASELIGKRAAVEAKTEEDRKRIEKKLAIEDPIERLEAIAEELKDL